MSAWKASRTPAVLAGLAWLATVAQAIWWPDASHWPMRLALLALGAWFALRLLHKPRATLALSPMVAFGMLCPSFYSILPALLVALTGENLLYYLPTFSHTAARAYLDGRAELLVLQFAALCIATTALVVVMTGRHPVPPPLLVILSERAAKRTCLAAVILCIALCIVLLIRYRVPPVAALMADGPGRQALDGIAPLLAAGSAVVFALAAGRGRIWFAVALACGVGNLAALLTTGAAKAGVYAFAGSLLLYAAAARLQGRRLAGAAVAILVVFAFAIGALTEIRHGYISIFGQSPDKLPTFLERMLLTKAVGRQTESAACLERVVERHLGQPARESPFYFVAAVVPRILWPQKPSLSLGSSYAFDYCGYTAENMPPGAPQSLSITLIGEPLVNAGFAGLVVAQIVLLAGLALTTVAAMRNGWAGPVALAALTPWLADFDQSFALYVANGVKMFLYMSPVLIAFSLLERRERMRRTGSAP